MIPQRFVALFVVGLGTLVGPLDSSVNIAFPDITRAFAVPIESIQWVVICYVLTHSSLMLVFGKLGDLFGHRLIFQLGLGVSAVSFVLCASAPSFGWLLFFRVCQGIGAALVISCGPALATMHFPEHRRARALGLYTTMFALGAVIGPSLGGVMVEAWGWAAVFWFRVPLALGALALTFAMPSMPKTAAKGPFDLLGAFLLALALSTMLLALNQLQSVDGNATLITGLFAVSILGFAGFIFQESVFADPIIRLGIFRDFDFAVLNIANFTINLVGFSVMLLVPYYLLQVSNYPASFGGLILAAAPLGIVLAGSLGGWTIGKVAANRLAFAGAVLVVVAMFMIATWRATPALGFMVGALLMHGFGIGLFQVSYIHIVTGALSRGDRGVAGSLAMGVRSAGVVTGATVLTWLYASASRVEHDFLPAFQSTFQYAALALLVFLAATLLRPRLWFGIPKRD